VIINGLICQSENHLVQTTSRKGRKIMGDSERESLGDNNFSARMLFSDIGHLETDQWLDLEWRLNNYKFDSQTLSELKQTLTGITGEAKIAIANKWLDQKGAEDPKKIRESKKNT
jgi:hypothetical protein